MLSSLDTIWILIGALLVFFMQAGFAMVETGFTRAKNAGNIIMKNLMDFSIGTLVYWVLGFGIMFGASKSGFIGSLDLFSKGDYSGTYPTFAFLIFQTVFCATAATIVSGAMAERTKFISYLLYSLAISAFVYPISGHWIWGGGFLQELGFHDFAGSTAVHMVGGVAALIGAKILGPRIGKYDKAGKPHAILGHSLTLGALGVFILWFCWFGFNGCSTLSATGDESLLSMSSIFVTTNIAAATASAVTMLLTWIKYKKPDVSMTLNGALGGLVAITAGCDMVTPTGAFFIGVIASFVIVFGIEFVDKKLKIDDPVGAIGVHGMCGATGTLLVGLFATHGGLFYGGGFDFLKIQAFGVGTVILWVAFTMTIIFKIIDKFVGLRVSAEEEIQGLDIKEHGLESSYADFMPYSPIKGSINAGSIVKNENVLKSLSTLDKKLSKIVIIINQSKLSILMDTLDAIGITGMTVTNTLGCGVQKGHKEYYRGVEFNTILLPKVKVEVVVSDIPVDVIVNGIQNVLSSGTIGDGKIFVYPVENVIKIRTGEEGYNALID